MGRHLRIHRTGGEPADVSGFGGVVTCNFIVNRQLAQTNSMVVDYAWWNQKNDPGVLHRHEVDEVVFIVSGECIHVGEGDHHRVGAGDFVYVEAGTWHGIYNVSTSVPVEIVAFFGGVGSYEEVGHEVCPPDLEAAYLANLPDFLEGNPRQPAAEHTVPASGDNTDQDHATSTA